MVLVWINRLICYFCLVCVMLSCTSVYWSLVVTCWEGAALLALVCDVYLWSCHFPTGILDQVWCLILSIPVFAIFYYFMLLLNMISKQGKFWTHVLFYPNALNSIYRTNSHYIGHFEKINYTDPKWKLCIVFKSIYFDNKSIFGVIFFCDRISNVWLIQENQQFYNFYE